MINGLTLAGVRNRQIVGPAVKSTDYILVSDSTDNFRCAKISELTSAVCGGSISVIKPRTDYGIHLYIELFRDVDCLDKVNQFDTMVTEDRANVYIFQDDKWYAYPESGAGTAFDNYPVVVTLNDKGLNTGERLYIRYCWYSAPNRSDASDWFSMIYPTLTETGANGEDYVNKSDFAATISAGVKPSIYHNIAEVTAETISGEVTIVLDPSITTYILNANVTCSYVFDYTALDLTTNAAEFELYVKIFEPGDIVTGPSAGITYIEIPDYTASTANTIVYTAWKIITIGGTEGVYCHTATILT